MEQNQPPSPDLIAAALKATQGIPLEVLQELPEGALAKAYEACDELVSTPELRGFFTDEEVSGSEACDALSVLWPTICAGANHARIDDQQPYLSYSLLSADLCESLQLHQLQDGELVSLRTPWSPHEPTEHTDFVKVEVHGRGSNDNDDEIDGDTHRDLEAHGLLDEFIRRCLTGDDVIADVAADLLKTIPANAE